MMIDAQPLIDRLKALRELEVDPGYHLQYRTGHDVAVNAEIEFLTNLLEPDQVCGCGKTSEGQCPRCGQIL